MSKAITTRTNADRVEPVVERAKHLLAEGIQWAREHPDEAFVAIAPWVLLTLATKRHRLAYTEALIITEVGYWSGLLVLQHYRQWKTRPATGRPTLKEVI